MADLISIIVPVYNTSVNLLEKCMESLISQSNHKIEIIIVDDGSKMQIAKKCDDYANDNSNVKVIHKNNSGLSSARNTGVTACSGDWIMFLDSDDWIEHHTCKELADYIRQFPETDFFTFGYVHDYGNRVEECELGYKDGMQFSVADKELLFKEALKIPSLYSSSCWKIYKRSFLLDNRLLHDEQIRQGTEDLEFMLRIIDKSEKSVFIARRFYHYIMNENSITNSFNKDNAYRVLRCFEKMKDVIMTKNRNIQEAFYKRAWIAICASLISGFMNPNNQLSYCEKREEASRYLKEDFCIETMQEIHLVKLPISRGLVLMFVKLHMYRFIYFMAIMRGKQKNRC